MTNLDVFTLPAVDLSSLELDFKEDEIWSLIKSPPPRLGPDGFLFLFLSDQLVVHQNGYNGGD